MAFLFRVNINYFNARKFYGFYEKIYDLADRYDVLEIFNNKLLSMEIKYHALKFLIQMEDIKKRKIISSLICFINSDHDYKNISKYFERLSDIEVIDVLKTSSLNVKDLIMICEFRLEELVQNQVISSNRIKKLIFYLSKCEFDQTRNIVALMVLLEDNNQFDMIMPNLDNLFKDNEIIKALANETISINALANLYSFGLADLIDNRAISYKTKSKIENILIESSRSKYLKDIVKFIKNIKTDQDLAKFRKKILDLKIFSSE